MRCFDSEFSLDICNYLQKFCGTEEQKVESLAESIYSNPVSFGDRQFFRPPPKTKEGPAKVKWEFQNLGKKMQVCVTKPFYILNLRWWLSGM